MYCKGLKAAAADPEKCALYFSAGRLRCSPASRVDDRENTLDPSAVRLRALGRSLGSCLEFWTIGRASYWEAFRSQELDFGAFLGAKRCCGFLGVLPRLTRMLGRAPRGFWWFYAGTQRRSETICLQVLGCSPAAYLVDRENIPDYVC